MRDDTELSDVSLVISSSLKVSFVDGKGQNLVLSSGIQQLEFKKEQI